MPEEPHHFLVRLVPRRAGFPASMTEEETRIMGEHFEYLKELCERGKVLIAGPCEDPSFGLVILETESEEEAVEIMRAEPSVRQGVMAYEIQPMRVALRAR